MKSDKFSLAEIYIVTHEWSMASTSMPYSCTKFHITIVTTCLEIIFVLFFIASLYNFFIFISIPSFEPGKINVYSSRISLPGYRQCGRIHIEYTIYGGKQGVFIIEILQGCISITPHNEQESISQL
jgi:hypothetical protein